MRVIIQRVSFASLEIDSKIHQNIEKGLVVLVGIEAKDSIEDAQWLAKKIASLRIFTDEKGVNNLSLIDIKGDLLLVSNFTLHARTKKGNRPSYIDAAKPEIAIPLYERLINLLEIELGKNIKTGIFGADMQISMRNDGPITLFIDSKNKE